MTAEKLTVGQEVRLVRTNRWTSEPPRILGSGVVASVGRRWAFAEIEGGRAYEFDMDTGYERGDTSGNGPRIITAEQVQAERRRAEAMAVLKQHRVEISPGSRVTTDQIEAIAAILRSDPEGN